MPEIDRSENLCTNPCKATAVFNLHTILDKPYTIVVDTTLLIQLLPNGKFTLCIVLAGFDNDLGKYMVVKVMYTSPDFTTAVLHSKQQQVWSQPELGLVLELPAD